MLVRQTRVHGWDEMMWRGRRRRKGMNVGGAAIRAGWNVRMATAVRRATRRAVKRIVRSVVRRTVRRTVRRAVRSAADGRAAATRAARDRGRLIKRATRQIHTAPPPRARPVLLRGCRARRRARLAHVGRRRGLCLLPGHRGEYDERVGRKVLREVRGAGQRDQWKGREARGEVRHRQDFVRHPGRRGR